ncbi:DUF5082 family protein [Bacillus sp. WMMC1349]|uniref:YwqH-like family protein n=1 Tax=Bacillus sp. WMMC1349 TaxID=2736254 RepID=UPI0015566571|nr:DUF5082 family protein [Bacillus sp. WMMC1349]NPC91501.1 DUF5082 family protein [Bacillus sp. WMMC1349]
MIDTIYLNLMKGALTGKKEDLKELKKCKKDLKTKHQEFTDWKKNIKKPGLSSTTWQGSLADSFKTARNKMKTDYNDIEGKQFDDLFKKINKEISSIESDIKSLKEDIHSQEKKIEKQEKQERQEKLQKEKEKNKAHH